MDHVAEQGTGMKDLLSKSIEIHWLTIIMVNMGIAIGNHWVCYAELCKIGSTGVGGLGRNDICTVFSPKLLNNSVSGDQRKGLQVWSAGECGICSHKGCHVGQENY